MSAYNRRTAGAVGEQRPDDSDARIKGRAGAMRSLLALLALTSLMQGVWLKTAPWLTLTLALAVVGRAFVLLIIRVAGLVVIVEDQLPEIVRSIRSDKIGLAVNLESLRERADAITWYLENPDKVAAMGQHARSAYLERYTSDSEASKLTHTMQAFAL